MSSLPFSPSYLLRGAVARSIVFVTIQNVTDKSMSPLEFGEEVFYCGGGGGGGVGFHLFRNCAKEPVPPLTRMPSLARSLSLAGQPSN